MSFKRALKESEVAGNRAMVKAHKICLVIIYYKILCEIDICGIFNHIKVLQQDNR